MRKIFLTIISFFTLTTFASADSAISDSAPPLIAHAAGGIDGKVYTNSREALAKAVETGYKYIEIDLLVTTDGYIAAAHDWKMFNERTGFSGSAPTMLKEFNARKIDGKYTPMDGDYIRTFFEKHRELVLVTDKIADYKLLAETFPFKDRMIVEVFSVNAYHRAKGEGFTYAALYVDTPEKLSAAKQLELKFITTHTSMYKKFQADFEELHRAGAVIMLFVVNNPDTIKIMPAGLYYTDWINPTAPYFHKYQ